MSKQITKHLIHRHRALVCLLAAPLAFMLLAGQSAAQHEVPFPLRGAGGVVGILPDGTFQTAWSGTAAHLGKYTATGTLKFAANGIDFEVSGTYTAADGAQISFVGAGQGEVPLGSAPAIRGTGTATFFDGTGRLEGVTGEVLFSGVLNSDGTFTVQHDAGGLIFPKHYHVKSLGIGAPDRAAPSKAQPSPFAGCYLDYVTPDGVQHWYVITIDNSGRISATIPLVGEMSGSISANGSMRVTVVQRISSLDGGGQLVRRFKYSGLGALDQFGNLFGELKDQYGRVWQFFWRRTLCS
jgi:hypothetical protein